MSDTPFARRRSLSRALQKAPERFRANLRERADADEADGDKLDVAERRRRMLEFPTAKAASEPAVEPAANPSHKAPAEPLFKEGDWEVTPAYLALGKDTLVVRVIGRLHRHTSKPPKQEAWLGLGFTVVGLFAVLMYMLLGTLKFNALAITCLIALLIAFLATGVNLITLRGRASLAFFDERGESLCKVSSRDIKKVDRLEAAVLEAIRINASGAYGSRANSEPHTDTET